jgi:hypothetical protein
VNDTQIDAAIKYATTALKGLSLKVSYDTVLAYTESSSDEEQAMRAAYVDAESCLALSRLLPVLTGAQLAQTGLVETVTVGKEVRNYVSASTRQAITENWRKQAMEFLAPYLLTSQLDAGGQVDAFVSKDKRISIAAI